MGNPFTATASEQSETSSATIDAEFEEILEVPEVAEYRHQLGMISQMTVAGILDINLDTLKTWRTIGRGPSYVKIGRAVWYLYDDILTWLEEQKVMTTQRRDYRKTEPATRPEGGEYEDVKPPPQNTVEPGEPPKDPTQPVPHDPTQPQPPEVPPEVETVDNPDEVDNPIPDETDDERPEGDEEQK